MTADDLELAGLTQFINSAHAEVFVITQICIIHLLMTATLIVRAIHIILRRCITVTSGHQQPQYCPIFFSPLLSQSTSTTPMTTLTMVNIDGLVQDCSNSIALAVELLQSSTKPSICQSRKELLQSSTKPLIHQSRKHQ